MKKFTLKPYYLLDMSYNIDGPEVKNWMPCQYIRMHIKAFSGLYALHSNWQIKVLHRKKDAMEYFDQLATKDSFKCFPVQHNMVAQILEHFKDIESERLDLQEANAYTVYIALNEKC